ncbi:anthranilate phosphoribosyltransferase [Phycisphaera mikurensis]
MHRILSHLVTGQPLSHEDAREAFDTVMDGGATPPQIAALLSMIQVRGATVDELHGAAAAMRARAVGVPMPRNRTGIDIVGTGGDHAGTFNVSTSAAIVTAAAGREMGLGVAKHGNKAVTSRSGSSQALEALGVTLGGPVQTLSRCLDEAGIAFFHAPAHHPAMRFAGPVRADLGFRTIFNLVGPLTNPAGVRRMLLGVYTRRLVRPMAEVLGRLGVDHALVVSGLIPDADGSHTDGLDEVSTCGPTHACRVRSGGPGEPPTLKDEEIDPSDLGLSWSHPAALRVDGPEASAAVIRRVLDGEDGPCRDIVILNAAAALQVGGCVESLAEGLTAASQAIDSGAGRRTLADLVRLSAG